MTGLFAGSQCRNLLLQDCNKRRKPSTQDRPVGAAKERDAGANEARPRSADSRSAHWGQSGGERRNGREQCKSCGGRPPQAEVAAGVTSMAALTGSGAPRGFGGSGTTNGDPINESMIVRCAPAPRPPQPQAFVGSMRRVDVAVVVLGRRRRGGRSRCRMENVLQPVERRGRSLRGAGAGNLRARHRQGNWTLRQDRRFRTLMRQGNRA